MKAYSLSKALLGSQFLEAGAIAHPDGSISKGFEMDPLPSGVLEESFEGAVSESFFSKLSDLLSKLPNLFEGQALICRRSIDPSRVPGFQTTLYLFEKVQKIGSYSHVQALLSELKLDPKPLSQIGWRDLISSVLGADAASGVLPDLIWEKDSVQVGERTIRALSLTELPSLTWKGCLEPIFESPCEFVLSLRFSIPDRVKLKRQLERKRRVSHALSISSSLEVKNIESNSVLHSSEETLERILVGKETLFEISLGILLMGSQESTLTTAREMERLVSGIGNAGVFLEGLGTLPV